MAAEHGDHGGIPGGEEGVWKSAAVGNEPAHGAGGTDARIGERCDEVVEPGFAGAAVRIHEDQDFEIGRELFDGDTKIVDLFAGGGGFAGNDDVGFHARRSGDAFNEIVGSIVFGGEDEKDFEILVSEFAKGNKISLEAGFDAAAWTEDGGTGSVKAGIGVQTAAHISEPLDSLPKQEEARGDLKNRQEFKEGFHVSRA